MRDESDRGDQAFASAHCDFETRLIATCLQSSGVAVARGGRSDDD